MCEKYRFYCFKKNWLESELCDLWIIDILGFMLAHFHNRCQLCKRNASEIREL